MSASNDDKHAAFIAKREETLKLLKATIWDAAILVPEKELKALMNEHANRAYMALSS